MHYLLLRYLLLFVFYTFVPLVEKHLLKIKKKSLLVQYLSMQCPSVLLLQTIEATTRIDHQYQSKKKKKCVKHKGTWSL